MSDETILSQIYHWEESVPDRVHFVQPTGGGHVTEYSWGEIGDQVRRMAAYLQSLELPPKSQIALLGKNSAHWMMADWAIWMAGHVTVPIYPTLNADSVQYILEHSEAKLLFVGKMDDWDAMKAGVPDDLPGVALPLSPGSLPYPRWDDLIGQHEPVTGKPERSLDEMATIVYTSGSTGRPKGVMHSFGSFKAAGERFREVLPTSPEDRMLSYLPLAHVFERVAVENASTYQGFTVYFAESLDTFVQDLQRARPTVFLSVPRLWNKFQMGVNEKLPPKKQKILLMLPVIGNLVRKKILTQLGLQYCRYAGTGSAPLAASTINWYRDLGLDLLEGYGMSEDFAVSHLTRPGEAKVGYVGRPVPGVQARITDSGELLVKSPAQMMGYFKQPEKTAEEFTEDGFFKTGDLAQYDDDGRLRITGRVKELFKTAKGKYVAPAPIENRMASHPSIEVICVSGANQSATFGLVLLSEPTLDALQNGKTDRAALESELSDKMAETNKALDPHEQLQFLVIVKDSWSIENGFLTPTMKIKRNVIEAHYEDKVDDWFSRGERIIWEA